MKTDYWIAVLGAKGCGMSAVILRLTQETFDEDYIPRIQDYFEKKMTVDGVAYNLKVVDSAGQDEMAGLTDIAIKDADAHIILYSVTSQAAFDEVEKYREKVNGLCGEKGQHIVLCGSNCEAPDRAVTEKAGQEKGAEWGCPFFEISAKENINIYQAFEAALKTALPKGTGQTGTKAKNHDDDAGAGGCCNVA
jgi:small GTP-binding protein